MVHSSELLSVNAFAVHLSHDDVCNTGRTLSCLRSFILLPAQVWAHADSDFTSIARNELATQQ